jgi:hypothetical protein
MGKNPRKRICWVALLGCFAALTVSPTSTVAVPRFFGVVPQGPLGPSDYKRMHGVVGTIRIPAFWFEMEPSPGDYDFSKFDSVVGRAAKAGIDVLPFVWGSPSSIASNPAQPPLQDATGRQMWSQFLRSLVRRYGPGGSFWRGRAVSRPIRRWQIWNEPNFGLFWSPRASVAGYAELLRIAARAIRAEDSGARILLAGVAPVELSPLPWVYLRDLLHVSGIRRYFDVAAIHPYAGSPASMAYQIEQARLALASAGNRAVPLEVTELGVASAGGRSGPMIKTMAGQARFLRRSFGLLLRNRRIWRISGVDWFAWRDGSEPDPHCNFCEGAGLLDRTGTAKPAWSAYRRIATAQLLPSQMLKRSTWGR